MHYAARLCGAGLCEALVVLHVADRNGRRSSRLSSNSEKIDSSAFPQMFDSTFRRPRFACRYDLARAVLGRILHQCLARTALVALELEALLAGNFVCRNARRAPRLPSSRGCQHPAPPSTPCSEFFRWILQPNSCAPACCGEFDAHLPAVGRARARDRPALTGPPGSRLRCPALDRLGRAVCADELLKVLRGRASVSSAMLCPRCAIAMDHRSTRACLSATSGADAALARTPVVAGAGQAWRRGRRRAFSEQFAQSRARPRAPRSAGDLSTSSASRRTTSCTTFRPIFIDRRIHPASPPKYSAGKAN